MSDDTPFQSVNTESVEGYIPKSELRELIEKWRDEYAEERIANEGAKGAVRICADELEALLDE
jgi:hypothetical protein